ncbi:uncharacterized protein LOC128235935 [Mya arenaria]|uniref:uncharacterized protein LOC128235935 n=1 Tax=Mya arenaria TaxID=6604 RepID=UPI0022E1ECAB|nr:uncharacterized protein LOC128235935 [Mya arenaria]
MTSTERCRKCRAKLKLDKSKHEQSKQKDRERKKRERAKQKEHARNNETLKRELKIRKCEEMQRYRAKKKQQKTHKTMNIVNSTARKMVISLKEKQAEDRKQRAVLRTQNWRLRLKLKESSTKQGESIRNVDTNAQTENESNIDLQSDNENNKDIQIGTENNTNIHGVKENTSSAKFPFTLRWSEHRALKRVKETLPTTPAKRARLVEKLATSPSTNELLKEKGILTSPKLREMAVIGESVMETVSSLNSTPVGQSQSTQKTEKKHAKRTLAYVVNESATKLKKKRTFQMKTQKH